MSFNIEQYRNLFLPRHIVAGLGGADRNVLAFSLALFDDSTLIKRLGKLYDQSLDRMKALTHQEVQASATDISSRMATWMESSFTDSELRLLVWAQLRKAFDLTPKVAVSVKGASQLADDMTSALIHTQDPPAAIKSTKRWLYQRGWLSMDAPAVTLVDIVFPILDELLARQTRVPEGQPDDDRRETLARALQAIADLDETDHGEYLKQAGTAQTADAALRNILLSGGALGLFSVSVSSAGFSAYILAAQASAFVPFVSGPGLVSFVSVISNPVFFIGGTGALAYMLTQKASNQINSAVGASVIALLAIDGLRLGQRGLEGAIEAFASGPGAVETLDKARELANGTAVGPDLLKQYNQEWRRLAAITRSPNQSPSAAIINVMDRRTPEPDGEETVNAYLLGALTVGDLVFNAAAINPAVIQATDFARIRDLDSTFEFSQYAEDVMARNGELLTGTVSNIKGYVAELLVAAQLNANGHIVTMPEASNQQGWDLLVDGQQFQVKFHNDVDGIEEHFSRFDYPVIANEELKGAIPEAFQDQVVFIDGLSNALVTDITEDSLQSGADFFDAGIPMGALVITAWRGLQKLPARQISHRQILEQVIMDGSVRVGLAYAGSAAGATAGLVLFGPAGAWVFGAAAPVLAQSQTTRAINGIRNTTQTPAVKRWADNAHNAMNELQATLTTAVARKRQQLQEKYRAVSRGPTGDYLRWRFEDEQRFYRQCSIELAEITAANRPSPEDRFREMTRWMASSGLFAGVYQQSLRHVGKILQARPSLMNPEDAGHYTTKTKDFAKSAAETTGNAIKDASKWGWSVWKEKKKRRGGPTDGL